jgi:sugar phosphate isomerase/epimerase
VESGARPDIPVVFSTGSLHPFGLDRIFAWAAETGFDGIEVMMDDRWDTHQQRYLEHLMRVHGLPVTTLHPPIGRGVWGLEPEDTLVRVADLAARIGASVVVAHPPRAGRSLERWRDGTLAEARAQGVSVAVENMPLEVDQSVLGLRAPRTCGHPEDLLGVGDVTLDTSHCGVSGVDVLRAREVLESQLRHVHLSDSRLIGRDDHRPPGKGKLPLGELLAGLSAQGYPGVVSLELKPWPLGAPDPDKILTRMRESLEFTRQGLQGLVQTVESPR